MYEKDFDFVNMGNYTHVSAHMVDLGTGTEYHIGLDINAPVQVAVTFVRGLSPRGLMELADTLIEHDLVLVEIEDDLEELAPMACEFDECNGCGYCC